MSCLNPYLTFNGNCEEALSFYRSVFGSEVLNLMRYESQGEKYPAEWKQRILHGMIELNGCPLMASDSPPGFLYRAGNNLALHLEFDTHSAMALRFAKLAEGGTVTMPIQEAFWGAEFGSLTDRFGIQWMFSHPISSDRG